MNLKYFLTLVTLFQSPPSILSSGVSLVEITPFPLGSTVSLIGFDAVIFPVGVDSPSLTLSVNQYTFRSSLGITSFYI